MRHRYAFWLAGASATALAVLVACTTAPPATNALATNEASAPPSKDTGTPGDPKPIDAGPLTPDDSGPTPSGPGRVYAHSPDTLYLFEPVSKKVTRIGVFSCLDTGEQVLDIAVDRTGKMFATTTGTDQSSSFLSVEPTDATCTKLNINFTDLGDGTYPNALSFVPVGTLDPTAEALVGYAALTDLVATHYVRIDLATGLMTTVGELNAASNPTLYQSSGDIFSLINEQNHAYLTVRYQVPGAGQDNDFLAEVDPTTGAVKRLVGDTHAQNLYGLGYWAGKGYGFSGGGDLVEIDMSTGASKVVTSLEDDAGQVQPWYGAGVTTEAPTQ